MALGAVKPLTSGKAITLDDIDDLDEDSVLGVGSVEDFTGRASSTCLVHRVRPLPVAVPGLEHR